MAGTAENFAGIGYPHNGNHKLLNIKNVNIIFNLVINNYDLLLKM